MAILQGWRWLSSSRFKMIIQTAASALDATGWPKIFLDRVASVDAFDDEIVGRFTQRILAADIVADDQKAIVHDAGKITFIATEMPNLKHGQRLGQTLLNRIQRLKESVVLPSDEKAMDDAFFNIAKGLIEGVRQRQNMLTGAMFIDSINYSRFGINFTNVWNMPSNLKVTPAVSWDNASTATPISDILTLASQTAPDAYGWSYNRITMSTKAFGYMVATAEFIAKAKVLFGFDYGTGGLNTPDRPAMLRLAGRLLDMEVILYDGVYQEAQEDGSVLRSRHLPINKVILDNTASDKNGAIMDWANCIVTESLVADLTNDAPAGLGGGRQVGPVGYYTGREDLNPPDVVAWAVARGFPRKHVPESTAVLTVGSLATTAWPTAVP